VSVGLAFFFVPLPYSVRGLGLAQVEPEACQRVTVIEPGFVRELHVVDGQRVKAGEVLAVLASPQLEIKLKINEADQFLRNEEQKAAVALVSDLDLQDGRDADGWTQAQFELKTLAQAHRTLTKQLERLVLRAPQSGVVQGLQSKENKGKWLEKGTELCRVGNDRALRVLVLAGAADQKQITPDSAARIHVHGSGSHSLKGTVAAIAQVDAKNIPAQLSGRAGGDVATQQDPVTKAEQPHAQHYLVAIRLLEGDPRLSPGVLGSVRIETGPQTLWWRCRRFLGSAFRWGL
jgi:putative peptide zinc metalloprotease protein